MFNFALGALSMLIFAAVWPEPFAKAKAKVIEIINKAKE